jgi:hypothetical protein
MTDKKDWPFQLLISRIIHTWDCLSLEAWLPRCQSTKYAFYCTAGSLTLANVLSILSHSLIELVLLPWKMSCQTWAIPWFNWFPYLDKCRGQSWVIPWLNWFSYLEKCLVKLEQFPDWTGSLTLNNDLSILSDSLIELLVPLPWQMLCQSWVIPWCQLRHLCTCSTSSKQQHDSHSKQHRWDKCL